MTLKRLKQRKVQAPSLHDASIHLKSPFTHTILSFLAVIKPHLCLKHTFCKESGVSELIYNGPIDRNQELPTNEDFSKIILSTLNHSLPRTCLGVRDGEAVMLLAFIYHGHPKSWRPKGSGPIREPDIECLKFEEII
jgi:hypothetical protein